MNDLFTSYFFTYTSTLFFAIIFELVLFSSLDQSYIHNIITRIIFGQPNKNMERNSKDKQLFKDADGI